MGVEKHVKHRNIVNGRLMYSIKIFNKISDTGLSRIPSHNFNFIDEHDSAHAILLRSQSLHSLDLPDQLLAIGRAGAGTNNVPVDICTDKGIAVFNTPGANANAVKELVIAGILLSTRDIIQAATFVNSLKGLSNEDVHSSVEKNKSQFKGYEVAGKTLGVVGLGAIGMKVANDCLALGLKVIGYDPFLSVNHAWALSSDVKPAGSLKELLSESDFISFHMPLNEETNQFVNKDVISQAKKDAVLLNFSREGIVDRQAVKESLGRHISKYVTDFPSSELIGVDNVILTPHLGASTVQAEENCAVMIADQITDYILNGNITNSVNFPSCSMPRSSKFRLVIANRNVPNMVGQITSILAQNDYNIAEMLNKSRDTIAYNILDVDKKITQDVLEDINRIDGVILCRQL